MRPLVVFLAWLVMLCFSAASAQTAPPPQAYSPPTAPPVYVPPPYALPSTIEVERPWHKDKNGRALYRAVPWRLIFEIGGTVATGRATPAVDGSTISGKTAVQDANYLIG